MATRATSTAAPGGGLGGRREAGELLLARGLITEQQLKEARLAVQQTQGAQLEDVLIDLGFITQDQLYQTLAEQLRVEWVRLADVQISQDAVNLIPSDVTDRFNAIPIDRLPDGALVVVMEDPGDLLAVDELKNRSKTRIVARLGIPSEIREVRNRVYGATTPQTDDVKQAFDEIRLRGIGADARTAVARVGMEADVSASSRSDEELAQTAPIIRIVNTLLKQAIRMEASDVHVEPTRKDVRVRYRIDGDLYEIMNPPKHVHAPLISRLKIMADMDIAERRLPQDGRVAVRMDGRAFDLRVSVIPTANGEKCVFRILDQTNVLIGLEKLGFFHEVQARLEKLIIQPNGIILSTGPTGSGKTTTQYSMLHQINTVDKNIITIEDPIEYQLPGISQVPVNRKAGLTFANALRSFLRQDPDIIMVGEIRDLETADIAVEASLTGHLVLSTLHTNDAPSAVTRLVDMGVEPFLISASVLAVLAQRLVKVICDGCRERYDPPRDLLLAYGWDPDNPPDPNQKFYHGTGCERCRNTGYRGRMGIFELMEMNPEIRELIVRRAPLAEVTDAAKLHGMKILREDAFAKVLAGYSTVEEITRKVMTAGE